MKESSASATTAPNTAPSTGPTTGPSTGPSTAPHAEAHYEARRRVAGAEVARLAAQAAKVSTARVAVFVALVVATVQRFRLGESSLIVASLVVGSLAFVVLVVVHERVLEALRRARAVVAWAERSLARLAGKFAHTPAPDDPKAPASHPYADDLDLFGEGSLLQSVDATTTPEGRALLAEWLSAPADVAEIQARQAAARELGARVEILEAIAGATRRKGPADLAKVIAWAGRAPMFTPSLLVRALMWLFPIATIGLFFASARGLVPIAVVAGVFAVQLVFYARLRGQVAESLELAADRFEALERVARMLAVIEVARFDDPSLAAIVASLTDARGRTSSAQVRRLGRIVSWAEARRNEAFAVFFGPVLLWDLHFGLAIERWRAEAGARWPATMASLARFEALSSIGATAFERPNDAWPIFDERALVFRAEGLAHPLLPEGRAVANDVTLDGDARLLLVTGSNMSGKSTLLRAMGAAAVLAMAGFRVRARALTMSPVAVFTSMRMRDSLESGVSHFFAEVKRLAQVVDAADRAESRPVFYLLDEILHGTNSRERDLGARSVLSHLVEARALGAVSTHDLALAKLVEALPGKVTPVHLREEIGRGEDGQETMTFDHVVRPGVVTTSNALRLMKIVGLPVNVDGEPPAG